MSNVEIPGALPGTKAMAPPKQEALPIRDIWVKWGDDLFNIGKATRIKATSDEIRVWFDGSQIVLKIDQHPHIVALIAKDRHLAGKTASTVLGMLLDIINQGGGGHINMWRMVGTLAPTEPVEKTQVTDLSPEELEEAMTAANAQAPEVISADDADKLGLKQ